jgi:uroporphyrinogen-III synthase
VAVLVTRPAPDNETTAAALRAKGIDVLLAPMLRFEPLAFVDDGEMAYGGVIATSANAFRALDAHPIKTRLLDLPVFVVGDHTAAVARGLGFRNILVGSGGALALPECIGSYFATKQSRSTDALLYLAGADIAHDLSGLLARAGFHVVDLAVYRMAPIAGLPHDARTAFAAGSVDAVLHYSRRSAQAFVAAARFDGVEITALALPQCCISHVVASALREAGASHVVVAREADEPSMLDAVDRALSMRSR